MALPPGFVPDSPLPPKRPRPAVPPHVHATHLTLPRESLKAAAKFAGWTVLWLVVAVSCFAAGRGCAIHYPEPEPVPTPIPVPDAPLRVILVVDSGKDMTRGQLNALASTHVRGWLDQHCAKDAAGRPAWRQWAPDQDVSNESADWQSVWSDVEPQLKQPPQVVVARGQKAKIYPLPDSADELLKLLEGK